MPQENPRQSQSAFVEEVKRRFIELSDLAGALYPPHRTTEKIPQRSDSLICRDLGTGIPLLPDLKLKNTQGGYFIGRNVTIRGRCNLNQSLIVIAEEDINVLPNTRIFANGGLNQVGPNTPNLKITLLCLRGNLSVGANAQIGGLAPNGANSTVAGPQAVAAGWPGADSLSVLLGAESIEIEGWVSGISAGMGGRAKALGRPHPKTRLGGSATAFGGPGGKGGNVILAACKSIKILKGGSAEGGFGGKGGVFPPGGVPVEITYAEAANGHAASAVGGDGGLGGDLYFVGLGPKPCRVSVQAGGGAHGGVGGEGGRAKAFGGDGGKGKSGPAFALGGDGNAGGMVKFIRCLVNNKGSITAGRGGDGDDAWAFGGEGAVGNPDGEDGGMAAAQGGQGGPGGSAPAYKDPKGNQARGGKGDGGHGGDAEAQGGDGGDGGHLGGESGEGMAQGGDDGDGHSAQKHFEGPRPPNGPDGGDAEKARSPGVR